MRQLKQGTIASEQDLSARKGKGLVKCLCNTRTVQSAENKDKNGEEILRSEGAGTEKPVTR